MRKTSRKILLLTLSVLAAVGMAELSLRWMATATDVALLSPEGDSYSEDWWKAAWIRQRGTIDIFSTGGLHTFDSDLGWKLRPGFHAVFNASPPMSDKPTPVTVDALGYRVTPRKENGRFKILVVGDSFTFGLGVGDADTFCSFLETELPDCEVFNAGVSGYGLGQMLIRLRQCLEQTEPNLVLFAFMREDPHRTVLSFRDYAKPVFRLENDKLIVENLPVPPPFKMEKNIKREQIEAESEWMLNRVARHWKHSYRDRHGWREVSRKVIEKAREETEGRGIAFAAVYLASFEELYLPEYKSVEEDFFQNLPLEASAKINTRKAFLSQEDLIREGHYRAREHQIAARSIAEQVSKLKSLNL